jgi:RNA-binding protein
LKSELKKFLRAKAHTLKPVVLTGQHGLSAAVLQEVEVALDHHELIKVRLNASDREERKAMTETLCKSTGAELIQAIGHIVTIYRKPKH